jgi:succinyl-diaminopimelate desuccinylase
MISDLVQYNTENPPVESFDIQFYIRDQLKEVGANADLHNPGDNAVALTSSYGEDRPGGLILYGHADVVPAGDKSKWKYAPYSGKIVGDRVHGRGSADMKAGLAAALFAYSLLYKEDIRIPGKVEFISVLDEENWHKTPSGWNTSDWLIQTGRLTGKSCIMGEPSGKKKICMGERGDYWIRLWCEAEPMHGSTPVYEENACVKLFKFIDEIRAVTKEKTDPPREIKSIVNKSRMLAVEELKNVTVKGLAGEIRKMFDSYSMNIGVVSGGTMINNVPEYCEALVAFCVPLGGRTENLDDKIRKLLKKPSYSNINLELLGEAQSNPTYTSPKSKIIKDLSKSAQEVLGKVPTLYVTQGTSDANLYRTRGVDTCFYGPGNFAGIHGYDESVSIKETIDMTKIYLKATLNHFDS